MVACSLLLLLGFLTFWNVDRYQTEKAVLVDKLETQMSLACSEYKDSVVQDVFRLMKVNTKDLDQNRSSISNFSSIIKPSIETIRGEEILFDSTNERVIFFESELNECNGFHNHQDNRPDLKVKKGSDGNKIVVWETENDSDVKIDFVKNLTPDTTVIWGFLEEDGFDVNNYKGNANVSLKFVQDSTPDTTVFWGMHGDNKVAKKQGHERFPMPTLYNKIDTIFSRRLAESNVLLEYDRVKSIDSLTDFGGYISVPYDYKMFGQTQVPVALFGKYKSYVFKKILPNLLISLVLFGIVALSFFFISKTWAEQLRLTKLKNEFISNMTHELNTPIATIGVAIEALENFGALNDPVKRKEYFDISKQEVGRLKYLVDKVLNLSTLDQGYTELNKTQEDLKTLIENKIQKLKLNLDKSNAQVDLDFHGNDFLAVIDREHFGNVIHNLIDNAIKYSAGDPKLEISIAAHDEMININFSDNGIGIPKAYRGKIFNRFFRVPNEDRHNAKGHGLGLHYVKTIIQKHKGSIELVDAKVGTSFLISIPKR